ncbi:MAG: hypothetical protein NC347_00475 [Clostridium sp.]|nr:hypothetical protein [Clostridium sp.]
MNDNSPIKIICRIINLLIYTAVLFFYILSIYTEMFLDFEFLKKLYEQAYKSILICAVPLIIMMIIAIIIKYATENKSKINIYRVFDTLVRIACTIPLSITATYYILKYTQFAPVINILIAIAIFYLINIIIRFTLQETLGVSFIIHDEL